MSIKRQATTELNHENWDQEDPKDDEEDTGGFKVASKDILEKRVIRTAKRRSAISGEETKKNVFSGFAAAFNKPPPSSFDFLSNLTNGKNSTTASPKPDVGMTFGMNSNKPISVPSSGLFSTTGTTAKSTTDTLKESSLFNTSQDFKMDKPLSSQTSSSAFASFSPKASETSTTSTPQVPSNIFGANNSATKITNSPFSITPATNSTTSTSTPLKIESSSTSIQSKDDSESKKKESECAKSKYYSRLKGLNVCVSDWIKQHVDKTPLCILSPIFVDYEKYLKEIQDEYETSKEESKTEPENPTMATTTNKTPVSTFNTNSKSIFSSNTSSTFSAGDTPTFSSGVIPTTNALSNPSTNNAGIFGLKPPTQGANSAFASPTSNGSAPFSFGIGKPFSFNSNVKQSEEPPKQDNDEGEDEPPKVEFTPVVEENSVYDKKCKIFVKKDDNFVDKGVGTLYIKKIEETGKHQLLVRANTSLGNVLLNFILSSSLPTKRMGKNNVMMVCIPTPEFKPPPVPILIRVKTSEEADDLLSTLEKYKS